MQSELSITISGSFFSTISTQWFVWRTPDPAYKALIRGVAERVFTDYLLEHDQEIISDSLQSGQGPPFWEQQILVALSRRLHVYSYQLMDTALQYIPDKKLLEQFKYTVWKNICDNEQIFFII
jgi:hypothetical protein